jgi:hypothetical protein
MIYHLRRLCSKIKILVQYNVDIAGTSIVTTMETANKYKKSSRVYKQHVEFAWSFKGYEHAIDPDTARDYWSIIIKAQQARGGKKATRGSLETNAIRDTVDMLNKEVNYYIWQNDEINRLA